MRTIIKCVHHGCPTNNLPKDEQGNMFCFPKPENLRREWIVRMNRPDLLELSYQQILNRGLRVCHAHFADNQFQTAEKKKLNPMQIPLNVFIPVMKKTKKFCCLCGRIDPRKSLHCFPKDEKERSLWKQICTIRPCDNVSNFYVCSNHFSPNDYIEPRAKEIGGSMRLKPKRFPHLRVPNPEAVPFIPPDLKAVPILPVEPVSMPGCCVQGCSNRSEKGFRLFRLPKDVNRRQTWIDLIGRTDLTDRAVVCEIHFDDNQYENHRADFRRLLRRNAVPNLLKLDKEPGNEHSRSKNTDLEDPNVSNTNGSQIDTQQDNILCLVSRSYQQPRKKRKLSFGDFTLSDMESPKKAKLMYKVVQKQMEKQRKIIKYLQTINSKLLLKIRDCKSERSSSNPNKK